MKPFAIAFSGRIKSGKSSLSSEVATRLNWQRVSFGDQARKIAVIQGLDQNDRSVLQHVGAAQVEANQRGFCQDVIAQAAGWTRAEGLVIDGLRHVEVGAQLARLVAPLRLRLVYVETADDVRETRVSGADGAQLLNQWESHSTETQVPRRLRDVADLIVNGTASLDEAVRRTLDAIAQWSAADRT
jgi:cytidylate kinase